MQALTVGTVHDVSLLESSQYLIHCKPLKDELSDAYRRMTQDEETIDRLAGLLVSACSLVVQVPQNYYPKTTLSDMSSGKVRMILYGKSNQYEGQSVWQKDYPGWTSPKTGLSDT